MTTSPIIVPVFRAFTASGAPLSGGKVYFYAAGTNTPKDTYTDFAGGTPNANPVILDSSGQAPIWLDGNYKINLTDSAGVQQANYPVDNVSSISSGGSSEYAVTTGTANAYILTPAPAIVVYTTGVAFNININIDNTGPSTINVSGLGTKSLVTRGNYPLAGGELIAGEVYRIVYDGTNFQILNPSPPIEITQGYTPAAPWNKILMNGTITIAKTSGGTLNSSIYSRVYAYLWNNVSNTYAPVATGRGASAAADFAANKAITVPDWADYIGVGVSAASLVTEAGKNIGASTVTSTGSITINAVTLSQSNLPAVGLHVKMPSGAWSNASAGTAAGIAGTDNSSITTSTNVLTEPLGSGTAFTPTGSFTGNATSVVQKSRGVYYYISY